MNHVYVKGLFLPESSPHLASSERGVRFGDGVFATLRVCGSVPYQWEWQVERLLDGCEEISIAAPHENLKAAARELLERNELRDGLLRISISRGIGSRGYLPTSECTPTVVMETMAHSASAPETATLWLSDWQRPTPGQLPTRYKLSQGMNSTLARMDAVRHGCFEALQCNPHGDVVEASSANIFWLKDDILYTPSLETGALMGCTRSIILRLSPFEIREDKFPVEALETADRVFLCNSAYGILPVTSLAPHKWQWQTLAAITRLQDLLADDIRHYTAQRAAQWVKIPPES